MKKNLHCPLRYGGAAVVFLLLSSAQGGLLPQWTSVGGAFSWGTFAGKSELDGVTGATRPGWGGLVNCHWPVFRKQFLTTGVDLTVVRQELRYSDDVGNVDGTRSISLAIVSVPLLYMVPLGKPRLEKPAIPPFSIGLGPFFGYVANESIRGNGNLCNYAVNRFNVGPYFQAEMNTVELPRGLQLGFYLNIYRTFFIKTYNDQYFVKSSAAGEIGVIKIGILLSMK
jgi:hypothetical protein